MYGLFCFYEYYPSGGFEDFEGEFESIEDARAAAKQTGKDYYQIVLISDFCVVEQNTINEL